MPTQVAFPSDHSGAALTEMVSYDLLTPALKRLSLLSLVGLWGECPLLHLGNGVSVWK